MPLKDRETIRILVAHRDKLLRSALAAVLSDDPMFKVVKTTPVVDACALLPMIQDSAAEIVLLHSDSDGRKARNCARLLARMRHGARVVIGGINEDDGDIVAAIECGAAGVATQQTSLDEFVRNVKAIAGGATLCSPRIASLLFSKVAEQSLNKTAAGRRSKITNRERQVAELIEKGLTNKEIAARLNIGVQTVKNHVHNILEKLNFRRRAEVARYAREVGWFSTGTSTRSSTERRESQRQRS